VQPRCLSALLLTFVVLSPSFTQAGTDPSTAGLIPITLPGGTLIHAEIANTATKRAEGLMYREHLDKNRGMLFAFDQAQPWTFWMKNTKIPLDIIWMNEKKQIIHIESNVPICTRTDDGCRQYQPNEPALYVLELGGGMAERFKLQKGVTLRFHVP
jgi:uncharacterized membrane protein (UPF0127 family)